MLKHYGITRKVFTRLIFSLRNNDPRVVYKYRHVLEAIGGFKTVDKYHRNKTNKSNGQKNNKTDVTGNSVKSTQTETIIDLISTDDEDDEFT